MIDENSPLDRYCPRSKSGFHSVAPGTTRDHRRTGTCRDCGATLHRAHKKSAVWWHDWTKDETRPRLEDGSTQR